MDSTFSRATNATDVQPQGIAYGLLSQCPVEESTQGRSWAAPPGGAQYGRRTEAATPATVKTRTIAMAIAMPRCVLTMVPCSAPALTLA